ncbi:VanW family protein [Alkalihalophilus marmarensis]|uniref:VanW family protein n=1 Tax=Alkalihalophilus marmarensis TaxID=521377 RepID=UPI002DBC509B|nr:VanW family protein [Alkalihalophilus marmarensis]MEC2071625.1 VanW family protein [Alkalihalophilus marmarensis]
MLMQQPFLRAFLLLIGSTAFLFTVTVGGSAVFGDLWWKKGAYETGTEIAGVSVAGMEQNAAKQVIEDEVNTWYEQASLSLYLFEETAILPSDLVEFQVDQALTEAASKRQAEIYAVVNKQRLRDAVQSLSRYQISEWVDYDSLASSIEEELQSMKEKRVSFELSRHFEQAFQLEEVSVASVQLSQVESTYLPQWTEALNGYEVSGRSVFSVQETLRELRQPLVDSQGLDMLATALFQLFGQTNIQVVERHTGLTLPDYTEAGYAASVSAQSMDFKVYNPNYYDYVLQTSYENSQLSIELIGKSFIHDYQLLLEQQEEIAPRTIVQFSPDRRIGDKEVISEGAPGYSVHVYHIERSLDGDVIMKKKIGIDYYPPQHKIEEWSLQETPVDEEPVEDSNPAIPPSVIYPLPPGGDAVITPVPPVDNGSGEPYPPSDRPSNGNEGGDGSENNNGNGNSNGNNSGSGSGNGNGNDTTKVPEQSDPGTSHDENGESEKPKVKGEE